MGLNDQIRNDILSITTNTNEFGVPITFTAPTSPTTVRTVNGTIKKHRLEFDEFGQPKENVKSTTCSVSILAFNNASYPARNNDGVIDFTDHLAAFADVSGIATTYAVNQWFPDEQTGLIVFILGDYGTD